MLAQYADGCLPKADILLTAMLKWDWIVVLLPAFTSIPGYIFGSQNGKRSSR